MHFGNLFIGLNLHGSVEMWKCDVKTLYPFCFVLQNSFIPVASSGILWNNRQDQKGDQRCIKSVIRIQVSAHRCKHLSIDRVKDVIVQSLSKLADGFANIECSTLAGHKIDYTLGTTVILKSRVKNLPIWKYKLGSCGQPGASFTMAISVPSFAASL